MGDCEISEAMLAAAEHGDITRLQECFQPGMPVNEIAIHAAKHKQPRILEWCYSQGWEPPTESLNDDFFNAVTDGGSIDVFQVLVDHGWNLNAHHTEACGDALAIAIIFAEHDNYDLVKWLLEHGHRATPIDPYHGPSAISWTIREETASMEMLKLLLDHGHELKDCGAGIMAADEGNLEALKLLLDYGIDIEDRNMLDYAFDDDQDEPYESQGTALYRACRQGQVECVELLLDRGADASARDDGGTSCIKIAIKRDHEDVVNLLRERGVSMAGI